MNILDEFADMLELDGFGTKGTNIFIGQLPAETNGIYLVALGGTLNNYLPIEKTVIDVYVQNTSSETGMNTIQSIKQTYHRHLEGGLTNNLIYTILALSDVEDMGRDLDYGKVYKLTLEITHRDKSLIS